MLKGAQKCAPFYDCLGGSGVKGVAFARVRSLIVSRFALYFLYCVHSPQKILILQKFKADAPS